MDTSAFDNRPAPVRGEHGLDEGELREAAASAGIPLDRIVLPEVRQIPSDGLSLSVLDWEVPGEPILFLHGAGLTAHTWDMVCLALSDAYHCAAVDLRGHGDSDWSADGQYALGEYVADIGRVADALHFRRFTLVGMSLGGMIALAYAAQQPERLDGLVLVDIGPGARPGGAQRVMEFMLGPSHHDSIDTFIDRAVAFNPRRHPERLRRSLRHNLRQTDAGWTWKYDQRMLQGPPPDGAAAALVNIWDAAQGVACPVLVVRGGESDVLTDESAASFAATFPDGRWVQVPGAGHTVQGDEPAVLAAELRRFLAANLSPGPRRSSAEERA